VIVVVGDVPVAYTLCSTSGAHLKIGTVESSEWPPKKGDNLNISFTGVLDETVTAGTYTSRITWNGFPAPPESGDINDIYPIPWVKGDLAFSFVSEIPSTSPSGSYTVQLTAVDERKEQLFCVHLSFKLNADSNSDSDGSNSNSNNDFPILVPTKPPIVHQSGPILGTRPRRARYGRQTNNN